MTDVSCAATKSLEGRASSSDYDVRCFGLYVYMFAFLYVLIGAVLSNRLYLWED